MQPVIDPIPADILEAELTPERFLRHSNKAHNNIYIIDAHTAPAVMQEIGRLRELAFREAGGGTGKPIDIDEFDTMDSPCHQLIVWSPSDKKIVGGYRFILGEEIKLKNGVPNIATSHLFKFSNNFINNYLPYTIELGRSFVTLEYQNTRKHPKGLFALDNLWDGLGALTVEFPQIKYLFGKVTMYPQFGTYARDLILGFLLKYFPDSDSLITPINPLDSSALTQDFQKRFSGTSFRDDYKILNSEIRALGRNIPPLVNAYMSLSPKMRVFGTAINHAFGNVEETGILLKIDEIVEDKKQRHINTYNAKGNKE